MIEKYLKTKANDLVIRELKAKMPDFLKTHYGVDVINYPHKKFKCLNPSHEDSHPSMSYHADDNRVHCWACDATYDIFDLIGICFSLSDFEAQMERALELYPDIRGDISADYKRNKPQIDKIFENLGKNKMEKINAQNDSNYAIETEEQTQEDYSAYLDECAQRAGQTDYFVKRGLSGATIEKFKLGYDPTFFFTGKERGAVIIPRSQYAYTARNVNQDATDRYRKKGLNRWFLNFETLRAKSAKPVIICEGEFDALSYIECGFDAVALGSTANYRQFVDIFVRDKLARFLVVCLDNDNAGSFANKNLTDELDRHQYSRYCLGTLIPQKYKDANEFLCAEDKKSFIEYVSKSIEEAKEARLQPYYNQYRVCEFKEGFEALVEFNKQRTEINTGCSLDTYLDGGLFPGLYVLGACSGLGKTDLIWQFGENIALAGQDVMMFALEMDKGALIARALSRNAYINANKKLDIFQKDNEKILKALSLNSLLKGKACAEAEPLITKAKEFFYNYAGKHLFLFARKDAENVEKIVELIQNHIRKTGKTPVVIVDYLQLVQTKEGAKLTDKSRLDLIITKLKALSQDYNLPLIALSSLNRGSYNKIVAMDSVKESGGIEYTADVVLGMNYANAEDPNQKGNADTIRPIYLNKNDEKSGARFLKLNILKNRRGASQKTINLIYWPAVHMFFEGVNSEEKAPIVNKNYA